ncbi:MAG: cysteine hydrolase family protein [Thermoprotei archaeon]
MSKVEVPQISRAQKVELRPSETALLIVDMQNDFVDPKGALFVPSARDTIQPIKNLIKKFRDAGAHVIYTQDWHMKDDPEFKIWGVHALAGTWGAEIVEELEPEEDDIIIRKYRYDAFFETPLDYVLRVKGIKNLVIVGTVANICVLHTAGSAALRWYNIVVPEDGISALTEFDMMATLRQIDFLYKGKITTSDKVSLVV